MRKKPVECPLCHARIIDADVGVETQLQAINSKGHDPPLLTWAPDYFIKCWKCSSEIAFRKIKPHNTS